MTTAARTTAPPKQPPAALPGPLDRAFRFSVGDYERMIEAGVLKDDERLELIEGVIVHQMPHNAPHDSAVSRVQRRLAKLAGQEWVVRIQSAVTLKASVPEPDVVVVPGPEDLYDETRPTPRQIALLVEVSDATLRYDQLEKLRVYAANGVGIYWIVNVPDRRVEVYTLPRRGKNPTYRSRQDYGPDDSVPVVLAGQTVGTIPVREILPR